MGWSVLRERRVHRHDERPAVGDGDVRAPRDCLRTRGERRGSGLGHERHRGDQLRLVVYVVVRDRRHGQADGRWIQRLVGRRMLGRSCSSCAVTMNGPNVVTAAFEGKPLSRAPLAVAVVGRGPSRASRRASRVETSVARSFRLAPGSRSRRPRLRGGSCGLEGSLHRRLENVPHRAKRAEDCDRDFVEAGTGYPLAVTTVVKAAFEAAPRGSRAARRVRLSSPVRRSCSRLYRRKDRSSFAGAEPAPGRSLYAPWVWMVRSPLQRPSRSLRIRSLRRSKLCRAPVSVAGSRGSGTG